MKRIKPMFVIFLALCIWSEVAICVPIKADTIPSDLIVDGGRVHRLKLTR